MSDPSKAVFLSYASQDVGVLRTKRSTFNV